MRIPIITRRQFLEASGVAAAWTMAPTTLRSAFALPQISHKFDDIRSNLLHLINEEREVEKARPLELDDFATSVATAHAEEMAKNEFVSHWGRNGMKPYQRYSFAGGYHATQENISAADNTWSMKPEALKQDTSYLHVRLYQETPPNDGHRRAILGPHHTHVGVGIAVEQLRLRVVELFISKYVEFKPVPRIARPKDVIPLNGSLLTSNYLLNTIEVFYEPLPKTPELEWLREPRSYALPDESQVLRPIIPPPYEYADKRPGVIQVKSTGEFEAPVTLFKDSPGIYTVVCWLRRNRGEKAFPATELCIRVENVNP